MSPQGQEPGSGHPRGQHPASIASRFPAGTSGNPGGMAAGFERPSALMIRYGMMTRSDLVAMDEGKLTMAQLRARASVLDAHAHGDAKLRLSYRHMVDDRVEGKARQASEVKISTTVDPTDKDATVEEQAMAAAETLRSLGLPVPPGLQDIIEAVDNEDA